MKFNKTIKVYGDTSYRGDCPTESAEQITFFNALRRDYPGVAAVAVHIRNEGKRTHHQAARHKAEGMNTGAADIVICGNPALVIELKRKDHTKSRWQKGQQEFLTACQDAGAVVCVALGCDAALKAVDDWL